MGLSASAVWKRARTERLHRIHRGVYALVPPHLLSRNGRFQAAVLACGPGAVLSHRSAAALLELRPTTRSRVEVTVPGRTTHRFPTLQVHRSTTLTPADVALVNNIPCTNPSRTIFDCAAVLPDRPVERLLEQAEKLEVFDLTGLRGQIDRCPTVPAASRLSRVLGGYGPAASPTDSELEELLLAACRRSGLPEAERQVWIDPGDGEPMVKADFLWREHRLILETDGAETHLTRHAFESDRHRDQRLMRAGWRVLRVTWRQIKQNPGFIVETLLELVSAPVVAAAAVPAGAAARTPAA